MIEKSRREYLIARILANSTLSANGCREWTTTKNNKGYGMIHFARVEGEGHASSTTAHRALYQAHYNVILKRHEVVCHKCDNPGCVEIQHLFVGSHRDNIHDMMRKGRKAKNHKLHTRQHTHSNEKILAIKNAEGSLKEIATTYGVSQSYVSKLRNGKAKTLVV